MPAAGSLVLYGKPLQIKANAYLPYFANKGKS
jgi:hypothetical protein